MNFWARNSLDKGMSPALIGVDAGVISYFTLSELVALAGTYFNSKKKRSFGLLMMRNDLASIVAYLACLQSGHVPLLLPFDLHADLVRSLVHVYKPDWIIGSEEHSVENGVLETLPGAGSKIIWRMQVSVDSAELHPDLGLLLSTSGTTGSPKLVKLSYSAIQSNAQSIASYLKLSFSDRALTVLPPYYSYGLSVINSHLLAGASLVVKDVSVVSPEFVNSIRTHQVTSISGVPSVYQMLSRTGFLKQDLPSLRCLTQAGGRLDNRLMQLFAEECRTLKKSFYVMYGQTEACARISYVPPEQLESKLGAIGIPIPGGSLSIDPENSEILYHGPNVMMGYAQSQSDFATGDLLNGILRTGDVGHVDEDGFFYVTGRLKRFVKLAGSRVGLDEIEQLLQSEFSASVVAGGKDESMLVIMETVDHLILEKAKKMISSQFGLHHSLFKVKGVSMIPLLPNGKKDYSMLTSAL